MFKAIIVDDEKSQINSLKSKINEFCPNVEIVGQADSIDIAIEEINKKSPDILFLDIKIPHGGGFELLKRISQRNFEVIFVTAYDYYAIKAFRFSAIDYILKPVNINELTNAVKKAEQKIITSPNNSEKYNVLLQNLENKTPKIIAIPVVNKVECVNVTNIIRIEAERSYSEVYLINNKKLTFSKSLADLHNMLIDEKEFYRCHRSHLINLNYLESFSRNKRKGIIKMIDGSIVELSISRRDEFMDTLNKFSPNKIK